MMLKQKTFQMKMNNIKFILLFFPFFLFSQREINSFTTKLEIDLEPIGTIIQKNTIYTLNYFLTPNEMAKPTKRGLFFMVFDKDYNYKGTKSITSENIKFENVIYSKIQEKEHKIIYNYFTFLNNTVSKKRAFLNMETSMLEKDTLLYSFNLPENAKQKFIKFFDNGQKTYVVYLHKKDKTIDFYTLNETTYSKSEYPIKSNFFSRIKPNLQLFTNAETTNIYLDAPVRHKYYIYKDNFYFLTARCKKEGPSISSAVSIGNCAGEDASLPIQVTKIDTKNNTIKEFEVKNPQFTSVDFAVRDNKLFYTFGFGHPSEKIYIKQINLDNFNYVNVELDKSKLNKAPVEFINYSANTDKIKKETIPFKKLYNKIRTQPSLALIKSEDSGYNFSIGKIKYKAYNSFGDWLGAFALMNVSSFTMSNVSNGSLQGYIYYVRNEIPKIYKTDFQYNFADKTLKPTKKIMNIERETILNNLKYFLKKKVVHRLNINEMEKEGVYLLKHTKKKKQYYIYSFKK